MILVGFFVVNFPRFWLLFFATWIRFMKMNRRGGPKLNGFGSATLHWSK